MVHGSPIEFEGLTAQELIGMGTREGKQNEAVTQTIGQGRETLVEMGDPGISQDVFCSFSNQ